MMWTFASLYSTWTICLGRVKHQLQRYSWVGGSLSSRSALILLCLVLLVLAQPPIAWAASNPGGGKAAADTTITPAPTSVDPLTPLSNPQPDANDIPSEMVSRFVETYLAVVALIESQEPNLQRVETDTESQQLQQEIQAKAIGLIQDHGLTLKSYWELLGLANNDP